MTALSKLSVAAIATAFTLASPALAGGKNEQAVAAIAAAQARIDAANKVGASGSVPGLQAGAGAALRDAQTLLSRGRKDEAIAAASRASELADRAIGEAQKTASQQSMMQQNEAAAAASSARQEAATANARAQSAEQAATAAAQDAATARAAPPVVVVTPTPQPAPTPAPAATTVTTETSSSVATPKAPVRRVVKRTPRRTTAAGVKVRTTTTVRQ